MCIVKKANKFPFRLSTQHLQLRCPPPLLALLGLLSASAAVRISFWEEICLFFCFLLFVFPLSAFRLIGFCRRSNRSWERVGEIVAFLIKASRGRRLSLLAVTSPYKPLIRCAVIYPSGFQPPPLIMGGINKTNKTNETNGRAFQRTSSSSCILRLLSRA